MNESKVKTEMVASVRLRGGYARRYEDKYAVGIPDTIFIPVGYPVFIAEVKIVEHNTFGPSDRQWVELARINEAGGNHVFGIVIGWKDDRFFFHENAKTIQITDCFSVERRMMPFHDQLVQFYNGRLKK